MKKSIEETLRKRNYHKPPFIIAWLYKILMKNIVGRKYNMHFNIIDDVSDCKGPCFIVFNHLSRLDHIYVMSSAWPRRTNMIAGNNEFYRKKFSMLFNLDQVLPKKNYSPDLLTIKAVRKIMDQNGIVTFAPEGLASNFGTNKPVVPGTSKMFKHFNAPVYFCHLEGEYLQNTKFCLDERKGETYATLSLLFSKEDIQNKSVEELDEIMNERFRSNEFEWNKEKHIKWDMKGNACKGMEYLWYKCPKCHKEFTMQSNGNEFKCSECGNSMHMNDYYEFIPDGDSIIPSDGVKWMEMQMQDIINEIREDKNYSFSCEVEIGNLDEHKLIKEKMDSSFKVGKGILTIDHNGVHYKGTRNNEEYSFDQSYKEIYTTITINDASYLSWYVKGEFFDFFPKEKVTGKLILLIEEMHRLHVNYYKNFKWYDYMYEGKELGIDNK